MLVYVLSPDNSLAYPHRAEAAYPLNHAALYHRKNKTIYNNSNMHYTD